MTIESIPAPVRPDHFDGIGCKEFARIIGASSPEVSRATAAGLIRIVGTTGTRRGPGTNILDREQAHRIAAAVECGIPWRVAALLGERLETFRSGIRVRRPSGRQRPKASNELKAGGLRFVHRPHNKKPLHQKE
jgi:hypothetical protein